MDYNFDKIIERTGTNSIKWDENEDKFGHSELLPMWVADMDFEAPPEVIEVLKKRSEHGAYGYTRRPESYYQAFICWQKRRHNWTINREWLLDSPGVVPAISFAIQEFTSPGDRILENTPVYDPFFNAVTFNDRELILSPLKLEKNYYEIDFNDLEKKLASGVKMYILCNPHNPVGRVWKTNELLRIVELCRQYDVLIVSDEIHSDLVFKGNKHTPVASLDKEAALRTITMNAPSKTFNIAGLMTSSVIIENEQLREKFRKALEKHGFSIGNIFGIEAFETAYHNGARWLDQLMAYIETNYQLVNMFLSENIPAVIPVKMEGTYLLWLDCRKLKLSQKELNHFFVFEAKLGLNSGTQYGKAGEGFMRMNIATPRINIQRALDQLLNAYSNKFNRGLYV